jgi:hypothetical protein
MQLAIAISLLAICLVSIGFSLYYFLKGKKVDNKKVEPKTTQYDIFGGEQEVKSEKDKHFDFEMFFKNSPNTMTVEYKWLKTRVMMAEHQSLVYSELPFIFPFFGLIRTWAKLVYFVKNWTDYNDDQ